MPSASTSLFLEVPPITPPVVPPVVPSLPTVIGSIKAWWNSLSTLQKVLVIAGVSSSTVAVVGLSRRKKE